MSEEEYFFSASENGDSDNPDSTECQFKSFIGSPEDSGSVDTYIYVINAAYNVF